jgi:hypothetical protein
LRRKEEWRGGTDGGRRGEARERGAAERARRERRTGGEEGWKGIKKCVGLVVWMKEEYEGRWVWRKVV